MKNMRPIYFIFVIVLFYSCSAQNEKLKDGDIIFIVNSSGQGKAIQLATKSKFTHVGIIFYENGKPMVYHAVQPVSVSSLAEFKDMSADGKYEVRRLKDREVLTKENVASMLTKAKSQVGMNYDIFFAWDDEEMYCSEYVWKLYNKFTKLEIGKLRPLKDFDLSSPKVKEIMGRRYGEKIPYDENMISPGDMFDSELLESVN
jgi:hypothetical protein